MGGRCNEPRQVSWELYQKVLREARAASRAALERLRDLGQHFPADFPEDLLLQVELGFADPGSERRKGLRVPASEADTAVVTLQHSEEQLTAQVAERSPGGLALRMGRPLDEGVI